MYMYGIKENPSQFGDIALNVLSHAEPSEVLNASRHEFLF
jgi:hypothetical protein